MASDRRLPSSVYGPSSLHAQQHRVSTRQHVLLSVQETLKREQVSDGRHSPFSKVGRISRQGQR
jgi:hypothetical protein